VINELATVVPHLLGISWMDPVWLLDRFGQTLFWLSLVMIFVECGLFFPFLPGDTLLFAMGIFISADKIKIFQGGHHLDLPAALVLFTVAAILGNVVGYEIGRLIGQPLAHRDGRIMKKQYFDQTHEFFEKHGNKALVIGRFVPFVRTYVTVVAGITQLDRRRFLTWSTVGASLWVFSITLLGFFLGKKVPWLRDQIDTVTLGILALSALPIGIEWLRHRRRRGTQESTSKPAISDVEV
jgi:membrane-associated protein